MRNAVWGLVAVVVALVVMLRALDAVPDGFYDIVQRGWPGLLVLAGLTLLLRRRLPFGSLVALVISLGLVAGVASVAYTNRADRVVDDQQIEIAQAVDSSVSLLAVNVQIADTDIEIAPGEDDTITGSFAGSTRSEIVLAYDERDDGTAEFTLREDRDDQLPTLNAVGRGTLSLQLPSNIAIALAFRGDDGDVTLNLSDVALERLSLEIDRGDALVTLPDYAPRSPNADEQPGQLIAHNGDVALFVPENVSARLELNRDGNDIRPEFDPAYILIDDGADGTLEKRTVGEGDIPLFYEVTAPRGLISLTVTGQGG